MKKAQFVFFQNIGADQVVTNKNGRKAFLLPAKAP
jgi:hypothetical protein